MTDVVLGAGGLIGGYACEALAAMGTEVVAYGRPPRHPIKADVSSLRWIGGEFGDTAALRAALAGARCVVHLLGGSVPAASNASPVADVLENFIPTLRLLDLCVEAGVERLVYVSSGGTVYGPQPHTPISETAPTRPISAYGAGKLAVETFLEVYRHNTGLDYRVLRVSNVFGPRQRVDRGQGVVATMLHCLLERRPIQIWGDGSVIRDFVYVDDVAQALVAARRHDGPLRVFNVGSGVGRSMLQVLDALQTATGLKADIRFTPGRAADIPTNVLDVTRAQCDLGWTPATPWCTALERTVAWMKAELRV